MKIDRGDTFLKMKSRKNQPAHCELLNIKKHHHHQSEQTQEIFSTDDVFSCCSYYPEKEIQDTYNTGENYSETECNSSATSYNTTDVLPPETSDNICSGHECRRSFPKNIYHLNSASHPKILKQLKMNINMHLATLALLLFSTFLKVSVICESISHSRLLSRTSFFQRKCGCSPFREKTPTQFA